MCFSIRPLSDSRVLDFFGVRRRVMRLPETASDQ